MEYIKKLIASWEIKYGQISITGQEYYKAINLFSKYIGRTFTIQTYKGEFKNKHFLHEDYKNRKALRLACSPFFSKLNEVDTLYLYPINEYDICISNKEPNEKEKVEFIV